MKEIAISIWFFVIFIPMIYLCYQSLQSLDYEKIVRRGKGREYKILILILSVVLAFLFASAFTTVLERIFAFIP